MGTVNVSSNGSVKWTLSNIAPGIYTSRLAYAGDNNHTAITSSVFTLQINPATTSTRLNASSTRLVSGQSLTLTATVSSSNATARTGTITFKDGNTVIGIVNLDGHSTAALTIALPTVGFHAYAALYNGDTNFKASQSSTQNVTIQKDATHATLQTSAVVPLVPGQPFTLTATISVLALGVGTATGTVTFKDGRNVLGTATLDNIGSATLLTSLPTAGNHSLTVSYSGDALSNPTTSPTLRQLVTKATTTTTVSSPISSIPAGQNITFTALVLPSTPATLIPTGRVAFKDGTKTMATITLVAGQAIWTTTTPLLLGTHF